MLDRSLDTSLSFILLQSIFDLSILTQKLTQLDFKTTFPIRHPTKLHIANPKQPSKNHPSTQNPNPSDKRRKLETTNNNSLPKSGFVFVLSDRASTKLPQILHSSTRNRSTSSRAPNPGTVPGIPGTSLIDNAYLVCVSSTRRTRDLLNCSRVSNGLISAPNRINVCVCKSVVFVCCNLQM